MALDVDWNDVATFASGAAVPVLVALIRSKTTFATAVAAEAGKATTAALEGFTAQIATLSDQNKQLFAANAQKEAEIIELRKALDALRASKEAE